MPSADMPELPRPRGRPRSTDRDVQIREAAWRLIAELGCAALTFEAIAQTVGCSRTTLYRRFASKAELIHHLLDETALSFAPALPGNASPRDSLIGYAGACVVMHAGDRGSALAQILFASRADPTIAGAVAAHRQMVSAHYVEPLRQLAPDADDAIIDFAFNTLLGSILHHVVTRNVLPSQAQVERLVDAAIHMARN